MQGEQNSSSTSFFLSVALCLAILVCIGWAVVALVFYRRATEAEDRAALAVKQEQQAAAIAQEAEQRAANAEQARDLGIFQLAYFKHVVGVEPLSEAEVAVVRSTLSNDPVMKKLDELIAADRARAKEHFDPEGLVRDDYHTNLLMACAKLRAFEKAWATLNEDNIEFIGKLNEALRK